MESPPLSLSERKSSMNSVELDNYFATYVPLSNLPTPPLSGLSPETVDHRGGVAASNASDVQPSTTASAGKTEQTAPATYLANLVPSNACALRPAIRTIETFLSRSGLPLETVALAACILDTLSSRFARNWRKALSSNASVPQTPDECFPGSNSLDSLAPPLPVKGFPFPLFSASSSTSRPSPNLVVLAALSLASSWTNDAPPSSRAWCQKFADGDFEVRQLNTTTRCMLKDIDYAMSAFTSDVVEEMVEDIELFRATMEGSDASLDAVEQKREQCQEASKQDIVISESEAAADVTTTTIVRSRSDTVTGTTCALKELTLCTTRETLFIDGVLTPELSPPA